jgi:hypothetical protein
VAKGGVVVQAARNEAVTTASTRLCLAHGLWEQASRAVRIVMSRWELHPWAEPLFQTLRWGAACGGHGCGLSDVETLGVSLSSDVAAEC